MMNLNEPQMQALGWIEDGLAGSDPRLASMLNIFSRLAAGEEMPVREKIRVRRRRPAAHRPRRAQRHPRCGIAPRKRAGHTRAWDALPERPELARRREAIAALVRQLVRPADSGA